METLTLTQPPYFLCRGMSYAFDGGVGNRNSNKSHSTPVVSRPGFPIPTTTLEQHGTSSRPHVHQQSRLDATASAIIDSGLRASQTAPSGSAGRSDTTFYRRQHQPANVSSSAMLDTIEHQSHQSYQSHQPHQSHQSHQSLQASPRGSPQALPIRSLAQVGPSGGGLPSVRQVSMRRVFRTVNFDLVNCQR